MTVVTNEIELIESSHSTSSKCMLMVDPKNVLLEFLSHWPEDVSRLGQKSLEDDFEFLYLVIKKQDRLDVPLEILQIFIDRVWLFLASLNSLNSAKLLEKARLCLVQIALINIHVRETLVSILCQSFLNNSSVLSSKEAKQTFMLMLSSSSEKLGLHENDLESVKDAIEQALFRQKEFVHGKEDYQNVSADHLTVLMHCLAALLQYAKRMNTNWKSYRKELCDMMANLPLGEPKADDLWMSLTYCICEALGFAEDEENGDTLLSLLGEHYVSRIQNGIRSKDGATQKYAKHLLKVLFISQENLSGSFYDEGTKRLWSTYFVLLDTIQGRSSHLLESLLSSLTEWIIEAHDKIDPSWWNVIIDIIMQTATFAIREQLLTLLMDVENTQLAKAISANFDFFKLFLDIISDMSYFSVKTNLMATCPFGDRVRSFVAASLKLMSESERNNFYDEILSRLSQKHNYMKAVYVLLGCLDCAEAIDVETVWRTKHMHMLRGLLENHQMFFAKDSMPLFQQIVCNLVVKLVDPHNVTFQDILQVLSLVLPTLNSNMSLRSKMHDWITNRYPDWMIQTSSMLQELICSPSYTIEPKASYLASVSIFLTSVDPLHAVAYTLSKLYSHPYLSPLVRLHSIILFNRFIETANCQNEVIISAFVPFYREMLSFIEMEVFRDNSPTIHDMGERDEYCRCLENMVKSKVLTIDCYQQLSLFLPKLHSLTEKLSSTETTSQLVNFGVYMSCYIILFSTLSNTIPLNNLISILQLLVSIKLSRPKDLEPSIRWDALHEKMSLRKWQAVKAAVQYSTMLIPEVTMNVIIDYCTDEVAFGKDETLITILEILAAILERDVEEEVIKIESCLNQALENACESNAPTNTIRKMTSAWLKVVAHPSMRRNSLIEHMVKHYETALKLDREKRLRASPIIAESFFDHFKKHNCCPSSVFIGIFDDLLTYGPDCDLQPNREAILSGLIDGQNSKTISFRESSFYPRVVCLRLLSILDVNNNDHSRFGSELFSYMLEQVIQSRNQKASSFPNTPRFYRELRRCQALLIVSDLIPAESVESTFNQLISLCELTLDPLGRTYLEWIIARLCLKYPDSCINNIFSCLDDFDAKPHFIIAIMETLLFIQKAAISFGVTFQKRWISAVSERIQPWITHQNFMVRWFATSLLLELWHGFSNDELQHFIQERYGFLNSTIKFLKTNQQYKKYREKITDTYYMIAHFDPVDDLNFEFIFVYLPKMFDTSRKELISSDGFERITIEGFQSRIPLRHPVTKNYDILVKPTRHLDKSSGSFETAKEALNDQPIQENTILQRKIDPKQHILQSDLIFETEFALNATETDRKCNDLIVLASLLEKPTNLGGLCRTLEIFNASALVVSDLNVQKDPLFLSLTSSSDKWLPLVEVKKEDMVSYLNEKKKEGYVVVGLEQTTRSESVDQYKFPQKTLLLLGNEKEGLTVELLQQLDVCLEIPQFGLTRSLNVHVSGAICIYEYAKQHIFDRINS